MINISISNQNPPGIAKIKPPFCSKSEQLPPTPSHSLTDKQMYHQVEIQAENSHTLFQGKINELHQGGTTDRAAQNEGTRLKSTSDQLHL